MTGSLRHVAYTAFRSFECRAKCTFIVCDFTQSHAKQLQIPLSLTFHLSRSETGHFRPKGSLILQESSLLKENHVHTFEVRPIKILFVVWCELSALNEGLHRLSWAGVKVCVWEGCVCRGGGQREMLHLCSITWGVETEEEQRRRRSMVGHFHIWQKLLQADHQTWGEKIFKKNNNKKNHVFNPVLCPQMKLIQLDWSGGILRHQPWKRLKYDGWVQFLKMNYFITFYNTKNWLGIEK